MVLVCRLSKALGPCRVSDLKQRYNFAAAQAGASVLDSSAVMKGAGNVLLDNRDKYMVSHCDKGSKWIVIQLSEDIEVQVVSLSNREHYSSGMHNIHFHLHPHPHPHPHFHPHLHPHLGVEYFQLLGSDKFPTPQWVLMGYFRAANIMDLQHFCVSLEAMIRYIKIRFLTHHGSNVYCTLTSVKVYGARMLETLDRNLDRTFEETHQAIDSLPSESSPSPSAPPSPSLSPSPSPSPSRTLSPSHANVTNVDPDNRFMAKYREIVDRDTSISTLPSPSPSPSSSSSLGSNVSSSDANTPTETRTEQKQHTFRKLTDRIKDLAINQQKANRLIEKLRQSFLEL